MSIVVPLLVALAAIGTLYLGLAGLAVRRLARRRARTPSGLPGITILKPLHGPETGLLENLLSFARQDYGGPVQLLFGVQRADDPAIAVVRKLEAACPGAEIGLVVDRRLYGTNRKVSNLANLLEAARHEVIVLADSDMRVRPNYLARLAAELERPGVGAVTCPYYGLPLGTVWSRLAALSIDTHFLPGVAMSVGLRVGGPSQGSTIALRREILDRIGGFRPLASELADDHMLGARVRALGLDVTVTGFPVGHVCPEQTLGRLVRQELRWLRTVRQVTPMGHIGSAVTHPAAFAALAVILAPGPLSGAVLAAALLARIGLCLAVERAFGLKAHPYWLVPARDMLSFALFAASFLGRGVTWRGYRYDAAPGGALLSKARPDPT